ncbi:unnamed protein product, partial [Linum tenue]
LSGRLFLSLFIFSLTKEIDQHIVPLGGIISVIAYRFPLRRRRLPLRSRLPPIFDSSANFRTSPYPNRKRGYL